MKQLHPKFIWKLFALQMTVGYFLISLGFLCSYFVLLDQGRQVGVLFWTIFLLCLILVCLFSWLLAKWTYHFYRYQFAQKGFQQESGIIWKKYVTIPYGRIQNIDIHRGVWDRLLGLSCIYIHTAGFHAPYYLSEGRLPGLSIEEAEQVREALIKRVSEFKSSEEI